MVTFGDSVGSEGGATKSSFDTGDTIYIKTVDEDGNLLTNLCTSVLAMYQTLVQVQF